MFCYFYREVQRTRRAEAFEVFKRFDTSNSSAGISSFGRGTAGGTLLLEIVAGGAVGGTGPTIESVVGKRERHQIS